MTPKIEASMAFPERFSNLPDYAFPRLRKLLDAHAPGGDPIAMTIGEPRHPMPDFVGPILAANLAAFVSHHRLDPTALWRELGPRSGHGAEWHA
jgi:hypothetical protein